MTTIIISILAALGIGGGVMLASSGGGGNSGGAAVVAPVNPGDSGSSSYTGGGGSSGGGTSTGGQTGGSTGGSTGGGSSSQNNPNANTIANAKSTIAFSGTNNIITGGLLATAPSSAMLVSKASGASINKGKITLQLNAFAPTLVSGTTYTTNETYKTVKYSESVSKSYVSGYKLTNPSLSATFDLTSNAMVEATASNLRIDAYKSTSLPAKRTLQTLDFNYIHLNDGETHIDTVSNATWSMVNAILFLGGRRVGLSNSDFGYILWQAKYEHPDIDSRRLLRNGTQQFYIFDKSNQLMPSEYSRYANNIATFNGNVVGRHHTVLSCGNNSANYLSGDISITLDFNTKKLNGAISNMKQFTSNININPSFEGVIYNMSSTDPNFKITSISGNYFALNSDGTFGEGVIVKGTTSAKDEVVGELSFGWAGSDYNFANLAFGAKKQ